MSLHCKVCSLHLISACCKSLCSLPFFKSRLSATLVSSSSGVAGHVNEHFCLFAAFITADSKGKWVVCGSEDHAILLWDLNKKDVSLHANATACMLCPMLIACVHAEIHSCSGQYMCFLLFFVCLKGMLSVSKPCTGSSLACALFLYLQLTASVASHADAVSEHGSTVQFGYVKSLHDHDAYRHFWHVWDI